MKKFLIIPLLFFFSASIYAQTPGKDQIGTDIWKSEVYGGLTVASNGWGFNVQYAKYKTLKYRHVFGLTYSNIKNYKEYRSFNYFLQDASGFYFGKVNSVLAFRPYYGGKLNVFKKSRDKGVDIDWIWGVGVNLSAVKPVYLKIRKLNTTSGILVTTEEPYNADEHPIETIVGRASFFKGFGELKFAPGIFVKTGAFFDISKRSERVFGLEVGVQVDTYFQRVEIMNIENNEFIYPAVYINVMFGKKFAKYGAK